MKLAKFFFIGVLVICAVNVQAKTYLTKKDFLAMAFSQDNTSTSESGETIEPEKKTLWLDDELQSRIRAIIDHNYPKLRLKYWQKNNQTVWFLDKIGKERPISFGISIQNNKVDLIRVLAFRESRGGEIRMQSFTEQFNNISIDENNKLDQSIDGITGATMSVNAMKKITRMALMLDKLVNQ
ncbi:FMN-binding protein [Aliikangiella sp. G2MR2-5]|uniref:FMN-binding protein n=1 Tax=Aliikangiella sp. G2MR2-5 TaxID=2788943 RepID=UPI0018AA171E|nr:FMN-binding protein [Aliikangiella sp. G2MR2-5]